jgi:hypothetical protein
MGRIPEDRVSYPAGRLGLAGDDSVPAAEPSPLIGFLKADGGL